MEEKRMAYIPMTLEEKLAMSMKGHELKAAGKTAEAEAVWRRISVPPLLAKAVKETFGAEVILKIGHNLEEANAKYGPDWLSR